VTDPAALMTETDVGFLLAQHAPGRRHYCNGVWWGPKPRPCLPYQLAVVLAEARDQLASAEERTQLRAAQYALIVMDGVMDDIALGGDLRGAERNAEQRRTEIRAAVDHYRAALNRPPDGES
jgi:hypothetical protein